MDDFPRIPNTPNLFLLGSPLFGTNTETSALPTIVPLQSLLQKYPSRTPRDQIYSVIMTISYYYRDYIAILIESLMIPEGQLKMV